MGSRVGRGDATKFQKGIAGCENEILKFIPGFPELRLGDLPSGILFGNLESPLSIMLHKMGQALPKSTAVVINSFEEIEPEINKDLKSKLSKFLNVGPFNPSNLTSSYSDEYGCIPWPDKQKPKSVAYTGPGTVAKLTSNEVVALTEALEAIGSPFLWPFFGDQHINTWMLENVWKIGVRVEDGVFTKNGTMNALELVLLHEKGRKLKGQISHFEDLVLKSIGPKGSSFENFNTVLKVITGLNL
ncbi:hypothetical protein ACSBR1_025982 [Camellia fascicularis]